MIGRRWHGGGMGMRGGEWLLEGERKFSSYTANSNYKNESRDPCSVVRRLHEGTPPSRCGQV